MRDRLAEALKKSTADYTEIRFESEDSTSIGYRGREIDQVGTSRHRGGIVRACVRGGWGIATFDSLADLDRMVRQACECAAGVGKEKTQLAEIPAGKECIAPAKMQRDFRGVSLDEKLALAKGYNDILLGADPAVETTHVYYNDTFRTVHFVNSRGASFMEERPRVVVHFGAVARDGSLVQNGFDGVGSCCTYDAVVGLEERVLGAGKRAAALLKAPPCPGGKYTVLLDQRLGGVFAHEAFGHLSEADFLYENPKMRDLMTLGRTMGGKQLTIIDDGSLGTYQGTHPVDDEGTPTQKAHLIKEGVLAGHLHSLETAAKMGERPTGNARAIRRDVPPIVRMTNTYIENGDKNFAQLIREVDHGIYACDAHGGQTMMEMFTFSAGYAYRIEKGEIGELVRDVVLTGNVFQTLQSIDGFGNDLVIHEGGGGCGKGGQAPLPVTFGSPHLRLRDITVGGK